MEVKGSDKIRLAVTLYEIIGTAYWIFAANWGSLYALSSSKDYLTFRPEAIGIMLFTGVFTLGPICGAHFNPVVSIAVFLNDHVEKKKNVGVLIQIILSQLVGAIIGALLVASAAQSPSQNKDKLLVGIAILCPRHLEPGSTAADGSVTDGSAGDVCVPASNTQAFVVELFCTLFYVNVVLNLKFTNGFNDIMNAFMMSVTLFCMLGLSYGLSGGCLNPTVGLVQTILQH